MKTAIITLVIISSLLGCSNSSKWESTSQDSELELEGKSDYEKKVVFHRDSMSAVFYSGSNNVFPEESISPVGRLNYFEVNEKFKVPAVFTKIEDGEIFEMKTSTDRLPKYRVYGKLAFDIEGPQELTLYQNIEQPDYLFLPFKDLTNTKESYGAGRYIDFAIEELASPVIDFNYCYNPYCAYNKDYSCPIPPIDNHLKVSISAGEKKWH
jgi:uncharacterized protein (DUF1684 family)